MSFDKEQWVRNNILRLLDGTTSEVPNLTIYHFMTRGPRENPTEVYMGSECTAGLDFHVHKLLTAHEFKFDYFRDLAHVNVDGKRLILFGSDGAPFIREDATVLIRLFNKVDDRAFILDIAQRHKRALDAQAAIRTVFSKFGDTNPAEILAKFQPVFGAA